MLSLIRYLQRKVPNTAIVGEASTRRFVRSYGRGWLSNALRISIRPLSINSLTFALCSVNGTVPLISRAKTVSNETHGGNDLEAMSVAERSVNASFAASPVVQLVQSITAAWVLRGVSTSSNLHTMRCTTSSATGFPCASRAGLERARGVIIAQVAWSSVADPLLDWMEQPVTLPSGLTVRRKAAGAVNVRFPPIADIHVQCTCVQYHYVAFALA